MTQNYSARRFQLWEYKVSHGGLLIRSPRGTSNATSIDLIFDGVEWVSCPRLLRGVEIAEPSRDDLHRLEEVYGPVSLPNRLFVLSSEGRRHLVVASSLKIVEHANDIFESPFEET